MQLNALTYTLPVNITICLSFRDRAGHCSSALHFCSHLGMPCSCHYTPCPPSIMVPFTQKYSNKVGSNKYFNQVYPIERGIPEAAFLFLCIQRQEECGLCFSAGMQARTTPLRRGTFHWCFLISATCFTMFFLGHLEVSNQHILGPRTEARTFERVTHLSATAYYVKGINCHSLSWVLSAKLYFSVKQNHLSSNLGWDRWGRSNTVLRNSQLK